MYTFPHVVWTIPRIFLIYDGRAEDNMIIHPLLKRSADFFAIGRIGNCLTSLLRKDILFEIKASAPYPFSATVIIEFFFAVNLINGLDLEVLLTKSFVRLTASINLEKEEKYRFSR